MNNLRPEKFFMLSADEINANAILIFKAYEKGELKKFEFINFCAG